MGVPLLGVPGISLEPTSETLQTWRVHVRHSLCFVNVSENLGFLANKKPLEIRQLNDFLGRLNFFCWLLFMAKDSVYSWVVLLFWWLFWRRLGPSSKDFCPGYESKTSPGGHLQFCRKCSKIFLKGEKNNSQWGPHYRGVPASLFLDVSRTKFQISLSAFAKFETLQKILPKIGKRDPSVGILKQPSIRALQERDIPGTLSNHFLLNVWWNNHCSCNDLESSNWTTI